MTSFLKTFSISAMILNTIFPTYAEIVTCSEMQEVQTQIENFIDLQKPQDVLLTFDIDMTLTIPLSKAIHMPNLNEHKAILKRITSHLTPVQKTIMLNLSTKTTEQKLIDPYTPQILQKLKHQGFKMIGLTASLTGELGETKHVEEWRYQALKHLNIDFDSSFQKYQQLSFKKIPAYLGHHPTFHKGTLFANGEYKKDAKGVVLVAFLKTVSFKPKIVVLVDDSKQNLQDVEGSLKAFDPKIRFLGIEYTGGLTYSDGPISATDFEKAWQHLADQAVKIAPDKA